MAPVDASANGHRGSIPDQRRGLRPWQLRQPR